MAYVPFDINFSCDTQFLVYLTPLGKKYLIESDDENKYIISKFGFVDNDINYTVSELNQGEISDITGTSDECIRSIPDRLNYTPTIPYKTFGDSLDIDEDLSFSDIVPEQTPFERGGVKLLLQTPNI
jgi:hypothetical protein